MATFDSIKVNLNESSYSTAVSQLESKLRELENCREQYNAKRNEIRNIWKGDAADEAYETIGANIEQVKKAYDNYKQQKEELTKQSDESKSLDSSGASSIQTIHNKIKSAMGGVS